MTEETVRFSIDEGDGEGTMGLMQEVRLEVVEDRFGEWRGGVGFCFCAGVERFGERFEFREVTC